MTAGNQVNRTNTEELLNYASQINNPRLLQSAKEKPSVWAMAKGMLAGDMYHPTLPIAAYEPLTELQRRTEVFAYTELLDQVCTPTGPRH